MKKYAGKEAEEKQMSYTMSHLVDGNVKYLAIVKIQKRTKEKKDLASDLGIPFLHKIKR